MKQIAKMLFVMTPLLLAILVSNVRADVITFDVDDFTYQLDNTIPFNRLITLVEYRNNDAKAIEIPDIVTYNNLDYQVNAIGDDAFANNNVVKEITFPATIERIGERACQNCNSLNYIKIRSAVNIGAKAFAGVPLKLLTIYAKDINGLNEAFEEDYNLAGGIIRFSMDARQTLIANGVNFIENEEIADITISAYPYHDFLLYLNLDNNGASSVHFNEHNSIVANSFILLNKNNKLNIGWLDKRWSFGGGTAVIWPTYNGLTYSDSEIKATDYFENERTYEYVEIDNLGKNASFHVTTNNNSSINTIKESNTVEKEIYNIRGEIIRCDTDNVELLPQGIYIVKNGNGYRKVMVK